ncbi:MAG TPA: hypothetical protein VJ208_02070 [Candidatus Nanoarchaeia archaeon]|nr:hypothetical protein [Candidatus Nanoarchaeia archaeon]
MPRKKKTENADFNSEKNELEKNDFTDLPDSSEVEQKEDNQQKRIDEIKSNDEIKLEKKEEIEYLEVENNREENPAETESVNEKPIQNQMGEQNKMLKYLLISLGFLIVFFVTGYFVAENLNDFEYKGITFEVVKEVAPYKTSIPVMYQGALTDYNFFLRNDPRELESIVFDGDINFKPFMVLNATDNLKCDGDGIIAIANLVNLYGVLGADVIKDPKASCDSNGSYMYLDIMDGNESRIEQVGISCYKLIVNNCEILKVTERFMIESFAKAEELTK